MRHYRYDILIVCLLVGAVWAVFGQATHFDFIGFDDGYYVVENRNIASGLTWENVVWALTNTYGSNRHPLTWISHMADIRFFGMHPGGHHLTSLLLHLANALLLFGVLRGYTGRTWESGFAAALFAIHPLHVESVAWVAERKDVLSAFFWLLTLLAYRRYVARPGLGRYACVAGFFALGLLAKPMLVTLPFTLLLLDFWPLGRIQASGLSGATLSALGKLCHEKIPLFVLTVVSCYITYHAQQAGGAMRPDEEFPLAARLLNVPIAYLAYIGKTFWPVGLAIFYPHPGSDISPWQAGFALLPLAVITFLTLNKIRQYPYLAFGWLWFLGTLVPVIGLIQVGHQALADRYSYIPLTGLFVALSWGGAEMARRLGLLSASLTFMAGGALLSLAAVAWQQTGYWRDELAVFGHAFEVAPSYMAQVNYTEELARQAELLIRQNRFAEAEEHLRRAISVRQDFAGAHNIFGNIRLRQGNFDEAIRYYRHALTIKPDNAEYNNNLGLALLRAGKPDEAIEFYLAALKLSPNSAPAHNNLALIFFRKGFPDKAIGHYLEALKLAPRDPAMHYNIALALIYSGKKAEAVDYLKTAVEIDPGFQLARGKLAQLVAE